MPKLIYAIIPNPSHSAGTASPAAISPGIAGAQLHLVSNQNISALVSNFSTDQDSWSKENALEFAQIIERFFMKTNLLPVRFATVVESDEVIFKLLQSHHDAFQNNLKKVEHKSEFGIKVLWDYGKIKNEMMSKPEVTGVKSGDFFSKDTATTNYLFEKIKKNKLEDAILNFVDEFIETMNHRLKPIPFEAKFKKMVSDSIMLDAVFLIENDKHGQFKKVVVSLGEQYPNLQFLITGPWPPYSFTEIKIE
ncbi:MAG: GvpL/GvpF family gas vesicle protein [Bacteroidales bacterium]|nr:GvpL/GvpF family gas vesicle protein [Bacteroidales bacterium]MCF8345450.1 GvpL/GvpF family gas vesicle protein [Bacteroidales bacterium]MCF8350148.1 GvpL/GvpF family gas vesicle protein [Bacteroidales bacterium]